MSLNEILNHIPIIDEAMASLITPIDQALAFVYLIAIGTKLKRQIAKSPDDSPGVENKLLYLEC